MDTIDEEILIFQAIGMRMTEEQINFLLYKNWKNDFQIYEYFITM